MFLEIFRKFFVLYFYTALATFAQVVDNSSVIELGQTEFPIERPFTISIIIPNSETRPSITFPDITGFTKKGILTSTTQTEVNEKSVISQVITQSYQAQAPGTFRLLPFSIAIDGEIVYSEGATLLVSSSTPGVASANPALNALNVVPNGAAFLSLRASKSVIYTGESLALTLSFFIADNYPYVLNFTALDKQLQEILKKIRPVNSWEESLNINELKPTQVTIGNKKFREYRIYQSVFFPLSNQTLRLPAVSLQLTRSRPVIGPPSAQAEKILFTSKPLTILVKSLPTHALRGRVPVGLFRLEERLERQRIGVGQSGRYIFTVAGEGNIATLPVPSIINEGADMDIFPPEERHILSHIGNQVVGRKSFTYFIVPHQNGLLPLRNRFQWIYFNPQSARYDTLRSRLQLQVGGAAKADNVSAVAGSANVSKETVSTEAAGNSLFAGLETMDSTHQPISIPTLVRATANVLIVIMLLGMLVVVVNKI
ncbi:BatD family protein [Spirosoma sp. KNUC1025]|uniref:BatD family protein n=1 Tax=Spirosoma sp. KNUC1025 TaxID=2894082 RepID=UPI0038692156|nr:BatD family protein [Spirosoma sp. KNUC1025]